MNQVNSDPLLTRNSQSLRKKLKKLLSLRDIIVKFPIKIDSGNENEPYLGFFFGCKHQHRQN